MAGRAALTRLLLAGALLLAACGGGGGASSAGQPTALPTTVKEAGPDACGLVSQAAAVSVVGTDVVKVSGTGSGAGTATTCVYASTATGASLVVTAGVVPKGAGHDAITQALNSAGFKTVSGLGDEAGEAVDANAVKIAFLKRLVVIILGAANPKGSGAAMAAKLEALARSIAASV
jgi:hypothetical protein